MNLQLLDFDCTEDAEGVVCWDALAQPAPAYNTALLHEATQVLQWAHGFDSHGPGPLEHGADWDFDLQVTLITPGLAPQVSQPRFVPSTGQLTLWPAPTALQSLSLSLTLSGTAAFVQAFRVQFGLP
jgi:hypothetical protein